MPSEGFLRQFRALVLLSSVELRFCFWFSIENCPWRIHSMLKYPLWLSTLKLWNWALLHKWKTVNLLSWTAQQFDFTCQPILERKPPWEQHCRPHSDSKDALWGYGNFYFHFVVGGHSALIGFWLGFFLSHFYFYTALTWHIIFCSIVLIAVFSTLSYFIFYESLTTFDSHYVGFDDYLPKLYICVHVQILDTFEYMCHVCMNLCVRVTRHQPATDQSATLWDIYLSGDAQAGSLVQQCRSHVSVPLPGSQVQGGVPGAGGGVWARSVGQQLVDDVWLTQAAWDMQRGLVILSNK